MSLGNELPLICMRPDLYHTRDVGVFEGGGQYFLATPFLVERGVRLKTFLALYLFGEGGQILDYTIRAIDESDRLEYVRVREELLSTLCKKVSCPISVRPFSFLHEGVGFGLVYHTEDALDELTFVSVEPGGYICFYAPWDGEYDT